MTEFRSVNLSPLLVLLCIAGTAGCNQKPEVTELARSGLTVAEPPTEASENLPKTVSELVAAGWTVTHTSLSEIERQLGSGDRDWVTFKAEFKLGDTVVRLIVPTAYWANSAGSDGQAIVRSGTVVATLATVLS